MPEKCSTADLLRQALWVWTNPLLRLPASINAFLLAAQILLGLLVNPELLYVVAAELALVLAFRPAMAWLGVRDRVRAVLRGLELKYLTSSSFGTDTKSLPTAFKLSGSLNALKAGSAKVASRIHCSEMPFKAR